MLWKIIRLAYGKEAKKAKQASKKPAAPQTKASTKAAQKPKTAKTFTALKIRKPKSFLFDLSSDGNQGACEDDVLVIVKPLFVFC